MRKIFVIGDSHIEVFKDLYSIVRCGLGPATTFNLVKVDSTTQSNKKLYAALGRMNRKDIAILVLGEIDCRIHIYYHHIEQKKSISDLINGTIRRYGRVKEIKELHVDFTVFDVVLAGRQSNKYGYAF